MINRFSMVTFSLLISIGAVMGLGWSAFSARERQALQLIDHALGILLGSLAGSRIVYVALHGEYYREHFLEIPQVWLGGLSGLGALWGALVAGLLIAWLGQQPLPALADQFFPALMLITVAAWLACWLEGVAYGPEAAGSLWGLPTRDEWGFTRLRFPTQLAGVVLTLGWFWWVETRRAARKWQPGWAAVCGWLSVSTILLALSFLRADTAFHWFSLRLDTWGSLGLVMVSMVFLFLQWRSQRK